MTALLLLQQQWGCCHCNSKHIPSHTITHGSPPSKELIDACIKDYEVNQRLINISRDNFIAGKVCLQCFFYFSSPFFHYSFHHWNMTFDTGRAYWSFWVLTCSNSFHTRWKQREALHNIPRKQWWIHWSGLGWALPPNQPLWNYSTNTWLHWCSYFLLSGEGLLELEKYPRRR